MMAAPHAAPMSNAAPLARYKTMRRIRSFEERVGELFLKGESAGSMLHLSIGEEAVVGMTDAMQPGDTFLLGAALILRG
jgi:acetoin:2,6-dichlorophenolindophenol oxidoreductase subunit alpha